MMPFRGSRNCDYRSVYKYLITPSMSNIVNIYSYIVSHDNGFAPNPFHDYCTLACCKPVIRRTACVGDWIIGLSPKKLGNDVVYFMRVTEKLTFSEYWRDKRFRKRRANRKTKDPVQQLGDNIYKPIDKKKYLQMPSRHSKSNGSENRKSKEHDLNGVSVLISNDFSYFGGNTKKLPKRFSDIIVGRGHKRFEGEEEDIRRRRNGLAGKLVRFIEKLPKGRNGNPRTFPDEVTLTPPKCNANHIPCT
jgi:hypothetical protein